MRLVSHTLWWEEDAAYLAVALVVELVLQVTDLLGVDVHRAEGRLKVPVDELVHELLQVVGGGGGWRGHDVGPFFC